MIYVDIFTARTVNTRNSLPNSVVKSNSVNPFKAGLYKFWSHQKVMIDMTTDLSGSYTKLWG